MGLHNMMEDIVKHCLKDLMAHQGPFAGLDDKMQDDVAAIALNNLPPRYVSTAKGEMFALTQLRSQVETDVYRELSLAAEIVTRESRSKD